MAGSQIERVFSVLESLTREPRITRCYVPLSTPLSRPLILRPNAALSGLRSPRKCLSRRGLMG